MLTFTQITIQHPIGTSQLMENLIKKIESGKPILVNFVTTWCGTCSLIKPMLNELAKKYDDRLDIEEVNLDNNPTLTTHFQIKIMPTIVLFIEGKEIWRHFGVIGAEEIHETLKTHHLMPSHQ